MESLSDTLWDVVIRGTGLKQSLLALSLSRSDKKILHVDSNEYYGGPEAAFSLAEADAWVSRLSASSGKNLIFRNGSMTKPAEEATQLSNSRQYSLALAPQILHSRSALVSQLVSSRAYRQVEFLAVGSFFILKTGAGSESTLTRIPSTREDVFSTTAIPARAKRFLMKFLKFVLEYSAATSEEPHVDISAPWKDKPLSEFLESEFNLDQDLQGYILALTLSLDSRVSTSVGLAAISRHLSSMGVFGPGFAAIYPKWGGFSEIAQVGCRAGAVGGGVYMLGTDIQDSKQVGTDGEVHKLELSLTNGEIIKTKLLVQGGEETVTASETTISRLLAVISSPLESMFTVTVEGTPKPAVVVVALPPGTTDETIDYPIFAFVHSSDTGECPVGQSVIYLTSLSRPDSKTVLEAALATLLVAAGEGVTPKPLYQVYYEQSSGSLPVTGKSSDSSTFCLPAPSLGLAFEDATLGSVREAWKLIMGDDAAADDFMTFEDREGTDEDDETYS